MLDFVFGLSTRFPLARWAPIPLRLIVGYGFMEHGYSKLSKGPDTFAAILQAMGVPYPHLVAWATILVELCGGLAVILARRVCGDRQRPDGNCPVGSPDNGAPAIRF
jgi:uncharacterized membrane protein YphA (DoxX/SURF4 family)